MSRIFTTLSLLSLGMMIATILLGLMIGDLYNNPDDATLRWRGVHMLMGLSSALAVVLVHSIVVTYFVGTSRWCKEVTETYRLDPTQLIRSTQLKRKTFPWCVLGMFTVVVVGALGAASDPGTFLPNTASMASIHLAGAFGGLAIIGWTYFRAWLSIEANQEVIRHIVAEVQAIRSERGLDRTPELAEKAVGETAESTGLS